MKIKFTCLLLCSALPALSAQATTVQSTVVINGSNVNNVGVINSSCLEGSGVEASETRKVADFSQLAIHGVFEVQVRQQAQPSLTVSGDANLLPRITTTVSGETLSLEAEGNICPKLPLHLTIGLPRLEALVSDGANTIHLDGLQGKTLRVELNGSSTMTADGSVQEFIAALSGASELQAKGLRAETVTISAAGSSEAGITIGRSLDARSSGASTITWYGNPASVEKKATGASDIVRGE